MVKLKGANRRPHSDENFFDDLAVHVSETAIDPVVIEGEFFVIEAKQIQDGGVEVRNDDLVFADEVPDLVRAAVSNALLHSGACEEAGEGGGMMVATE